MVIRIFGLYSGIILLCVNITSLSPHYTIDVSDQ